MNYTYMKKLKNYIDKSNDEITKEIFDVSTKAVTNSWGYTNAMNEYIKSLKIFKMMNRLKLKFFKKNYVKYIERKFDKKIRVLFLVNEYNVFPSFKSIYDELENDKNFICSLVHVPFTHHNKTTKIEDELETYKKNGYEKIIESDNYDLCKESPDIVFYLKPYDSIPKKYYVTEIEKVIDKIIYISYGINCVNEKNSLDYNYKTEMSDKAWLNLSHCTTHKKLANKFSKQKGKNFIMIGHPRLDLVDLDFSEHDLYKNIKKKAKGRKIFLYDPHHSINEEYKWGTFKKYGLDILNYFKEHPKLFLVYRPHPLLKGALLKEYKNDKKFFKEYDSLIKSENIFFDNDVNYLISMHISDCLIADANSFVPEFCMYNKPVIYLKYNNGNCIDDKELLSIIYTAKNYEDIKKYIEKISKGEDALKDYRSKKIVSYFGYDKKNSVAKKLKNIIKKEFYN